LGSHGRAVATEIRTFYDSIRRFLCNDRPSVAINFVGDHEIQGEDLDTLLNDPYVTSKKIVTIKIRGHNFYIKPTRSASVNLSSEFGVECRCSIEGDRDAALLLRNQIEETLQGCAPWYAKLYLPSGTTSDGVRLGIGLTICWTIAVVLAIFLTTVPGHKIDLLFLMQWSGCGFVLLWIWLFLNRQMFPRLLFDIGKSAEKVAASKYWRNTVFVGLVLAVIAGVVSSLITDRLKG